MRSDCWSTKQLKQAYKEYAKPRTTLEFINWINTHPNYSLMDECSSKYVRQGTYPKNPTFSNIAKIHSNKWKNINAEIQSYAQKLDFSPSESKLKSWPAKTKYNIRHQFNYGFTKQTFPIPITSYSTHMGDKFPLLTKLAEQFGLEHMIAHANYQPSSSTYARHTDFLGDMISNALKKDPKIGDLPWDLKNCCPKGMQGIRILIALTEWVPGHVFGFENHYWIWKQGEGIKFDYANTRHYTANLSYTPRIFLKVSGFMPKNKNHWLYKNTKKIKHIKF